MRLILIGLGLALAASFALTRVLVGMLFRVTPNRLFNLRRRFISGVERRAVGLFHSGAPRDESRSIDSSALRVKEACRSVGRDLNKEPLWNRFSVMFVTR